MLPAGASFCTSCGTPVQPQTQALPTDGPAPTPAFPQDGAAPSAPRLPSDGNPAERPAWTPQPPPTAYPAYPSYPPPSAPQPPPSYPPAAYPPPPAYQPPPGYPPPAYQQQTAAFEAPAQTTKSKTPLIVGIVVLVLLLGGGVAAGFVIGGSKGSATASVQPTEDPVVEPTQDPVAEETTEPELSFSPEPVAVDPQRRAAVTLRQMSREGFSATRFDGEYVPQLSSKFGGITDANQETSSGSHIFQNTDIIDEFNSISGRLSDTTVVMLYSLDYGKKTSRVGNNPLWVTVALEYYSTPEGVHQWCADHFPGLTGSDLDNQCIPTQLNPKP